MQSLDEDLPKGLYKHPAAEDLRRAKRGAGTNVCKTEAISRRKAQQKNTPRLRHKRCPKSTEGMTSEICQIMA